MKTAVFGGGCFWCTEAVFLAIRGVQSVEPGYCGGHLDSPSYEQVCSGSTGHIEVVRIVFDEQVVTFEQLLDVFFATHDPTTPGRQGHDVGPQYQSVVFFQDQQQKVAVDSKIAEIDGAEIFPAKVCTLVLPAQHFWVAEPYHHNYFERNPAQGYCQMVVAPKVVKFRKTFEKWLK